MLVATPIGNLGDLAPRAEQALREAGLWIVEDSRVSGKLAAHLGIKKPMRVLNDHTPEATVERWVAEIASGVRAALVTDGGCPVVSDPGARIADLCRERDIPVEAVPGASAVTLALMLSGFYAQRFAFLGFLARKKGPMAQELSPFADSPYTLVLFEAPNRLGPLLEVAGEQLGARRYALCRELTKLHEQVYRGTLPHVPSEGEFPRKGELTVVIEGKRRRQSADHS